VETCKRDDEGINGQGKLNFSRLVAHGFDKHFLIQIVDVTRECHHMFVMRIALLRAVEHGSIINMDLGVHHQLRLGWREELSLN
jgi:hypothetical protein